MEGGYISAGETYCFDSSDAVGVGVGVGIAVGITGGRGRRG